MKFPTLLPLLSIALLSACASKPTPPLRVNMPPSAHEALLQPEAGADETAPVADSSIRYRVGDQFVSLEELRSGAIDQDSTVVILAEPSVTFSRISEVLHELYRLGYLVSFQAQEADTP